jgi:hypothetical protein
MASKTNITNILLVLTSTLIGIVFFSVVFQNTINVPSYDDYDTVLAFIKRTSQPSLSLFDRIKLIFEIHVQHFVAITRIIGLAYYKLFRHINFAHLAIIQNAFLVGVLVLTLCIVRLHNISIYAVIVAIACCLFNLSFWQSAIYFNCGSQHFAVFFFAFLSLYLLNISNQSVWFFVIALFCAMLAIVSFGNGVLVIPLGAFVLWIKKRKWELWAGGWIVALSLFWIALILQNQNRATRSLNTINVLNVAKLFFTFLGSFLNINMASPQYAYINVGICLLVGIAVFVFWLWCFFGGYARQMPLLFSFLSLPILTGLSIGIARFDGGASAGITSRYMFFSACIPIVLVLMCADLGKTKYLKPLTLLLLSVWFFNLVNVLPKIKKTNYEIVTTAAQWQKDHRAALVIDQPNEKRFGKTLDWAIRNGIYDFEEDK